MKTQTQNSKSHHFGLEQGRQKPNRPATIINVIPTKQSNKLLRTHASSAVCQPEHGTINPLHRHKTTMNRHRTANVDISDAAPFFSHALFSFISNIRWRRGEGQQMWTSQMQHPSSHNIVQLHLKYPMVSWGTTVPSCRLCIAC